jgi:hypothetical protein
MTQICSRIWNMLDAVTQSHRVKGARDAWLVTIGEAHPRLKPLLHTSLDRFRIRIQANGVPAETYSALQKLPITRTDIEYAAPTSPNQIKVSSVIVEFKP